MIAARMTAFGEYSDDGTASTVKARDHKDATDLIAFNSREDPEVTGDRTGPLGASSPQTQAIAFAADFAWAVRRLTPVECERLQGFPDHHTQIPWCGKPADQCPGGPRYKALGNSMAVNCMRWIGTRIQMIEDMA